MEVEVVKFDNLGRGIGYINNKIVFIPKSVPGDILNIEITKEKKDYFEGKIKEIIKPSKLRQDIICPFFSECGGCDLLEISLTESLEFKIRKVNDILKKFKINYIVKDIIKSDSRYNYRSKVSLKVENSKIGFFESESHKLVEIDKCFLCKESINNLILDLPLLKINNGTITIRSNYKDELLVIINSLDKLYNIEQLESRHKIIGIIQNDNTIVGDNFFIENINDYLFKVSYNSFFQVNSNICSKLFNYIKDYTSNSKNILDLYCGVGTLSIVASKNSSNVLGVEILENAIFDANINKSFNNASNTEFLCEDTKKIIGRITNEFDTLILDPPRSGVVKDVLEKIKLEKIEKIIYISCNPITLARDIKILEDNYEIKEFTLFDMFVNCEHVESFVVLERK